MSSKTKLAAAIVLAIAIAGGATAFALVWDTDQKTNSLTIAGPMDIAVVEPSWESAGKAQAASGILPGTTVPKDPYVRNDSDVPIYAMVEISMPLLDGHDAFVFTPKDGWEDPNVASGGAASAYEGEIRNGKRVFEYYYTEPLSPGATTASPVFDHVTLNFAIKNVSPSDTAQNVIVKATGFEKTAVDAASDSLTNKAFQGHELCSAGA